MVGNSLLMRLCSPLQTAPEACLALWVGGLDDIPQPAQDGEDTSASRGLSCKILWAKQ